MNATYSKKYCEARLEYVIAAFYGGDGAELAQGMEKIRELVREYRKLPDHSGILVGAVELIYSKINHNLNFKFA